MLTSLTSPEHIHTAAVLSRGIQRIPHLQALLPEYDRVVPTRSIRRGTFDVVIGWGHKDTACKARGVALQANVPYLALEDGFLRSVAPGVTGAPPLSIVVDDVGIYYDATTPSRLELLLENGGWETAALLDRSRRAIDRILRERLSKYNHAPDLSNELPGNEKHKVLVVDQTFDDCSITYGMADAETFKQMLAAAIYENPESDIIIKSHPDVLAGKKRGYLTSTETLAPRVHLLAEEVNPLSLLKNVVKVYTVTSQLGFEALLLGKPVECFGIPFYSGWGLTGDRQTVIRRTKRRSIEEVFAAAYILYPRYLNPLTKMSGTLEDVIDFLASQVEHQRLLSGHNLLCTGLHWWKRPYIRKILKTPGNRVIFTNHPKTLAQVDKVVVWGDGDDSVTVQAAEQKGIPVLRMEDGFIRSVGLGSNLVRPLSLVLDSSGIYFDPTRPSDLETMLRETEFSKEFCLQATALQRRIVDERFSKYNVGADLPLVIKAVPDQTIILVPGQVEDDASIRLGCVDLRTNLELLAEVRRQNPGAYIIYKPHPDVIAGNRKGRISKPEVKQYCDQIVTDQSMPACLDSSDEVHTLTSLAGFEALLHSKKVVCYGLPFYAGWGLTEDRHTLSRRGRQLAVEELVAGVLILYSRYIDWEQGEIIPVEVALDRLFNDKVSAGFYGNIDTGTVRQWIRKLSGFFAAIR